MESSGRARRVRILIGSPLESDLVERIRAVDPRVEVVYRPDLLGAPRFHADHTALLQRTAEQEREWRGLMAEAEVMLDTYRPSSSNLPESAPNLRWIQFSSSGVGGMVRGMGLWDSPVLVTNVAGIHARPLAEFVLFAMLFFAKQMPRVLIDQRLRHWERFSGYSLRGKTVGILGMGKVGREVARLARALDMKAVGTRRAHTADPGALGVDAIYPRDDLGPILGASDFLVLSLPATPETDGMMGERQFAQMKQGAVLINIARGSVIDEPALIRALQSGHLSGAALDVVAKEPLDPGSPLWDMPNVLITPHSMSTVIGENELVVEIFADNLRRYLAGEPLHHVFDRERGY